MLVQNNNFRTYKIVDNTVPSLSCRLMRPCPLPWEGIEVRGRIFLPAVATRQRCGRAGIPLTLVAVATRPLQREREYYFGHQ
jgi:hypothetical protein